jgi:hypothetical protein
VIGHRDEAPPSGRGWASHALEASSSAVRGLASIFGSLFAAGPICLFYSLYTRSRELLRNATDEFSWAAGSSRSSFFSPSAVTLCRGTPDPTLWRSGSALRPARACWGTCRASSDPWSLGECGQDRGRAPGRVRSPVRAGAGAGSHFRGFVDRPGGRLRGFPTSGRRAPPTPFSPARVILSLCLLASVCQLPCRSCAGSSEPPEEGVLPRRLRAALWEPCGAARLWAAPGSGPPFSLLRAVRWPGPGPGRRLHRRPEPLGVIELTRPVALVPSSLSSPTRT